jgi:hypothetical protein
MRRPRARGVYTLHPVTHEDFGNADGSSRECFDISQCRGVAADSVPSSRDTVLCMACSHEVVGFDVRLMYALTHISSCIPHPLPLHRSPSCSTQQATTSAVCDFRRRSILKGPTSTMDLHKPLWTRMWFFVGLLLSYAVCPNRNISALVFITNCFGCGQHRP